MVTLQFVEKQRECEEAALKSLIQCLSTEVHSNKLLIAQFNDRCVAFSLKENEWGMLLAAWYMIHKDCVQIKHT